MNQLILLRTVTKEMLEGIWTLGALSGTVAHEYIFHVSVLSDHQQPFCEEGESSVIFMS